MPFIQISNLLCITEDFDLFFLFKDVFVFACVYHGECIFIFTVFRANFFFFFAISVCMSLYVGAAEDHVDGGG